jgi:transposase-like protein
LRPSNQRIFTALVGACPHYPPSIRGFSPPSTAEIAQAFGVAKISLKRAVKRYREEGPRGFYAQRKGRGPAVLTPAVLAEAQQLLDDGLETAAVAERLGVKPDTLSKAVRAGRLHKPVKKTPASR